MGEVWRARDTRLDREVAIKVLPQSMSSSEEMRKRFEREARAIAQVSHPHICALHDLGREGETEFLVMELLEGETLAERLTKGALPLDLTLQFGAEIASALDSAHGKGIVHRDLKPGNVMVTASGVKLLDFGLARILSTDKPVEMLTSAPTAARDVTREGSILGTLSYMAPEQLEGKPADARADIFALGAVLYEMATGQKAFTGTSQASLISAIMTSEPPAVSSLQAASPPALDRLVRACLAKEPAGRWKSAHDVGLQLREIIESSRGARESSAWTASPAAEGAPESGPGHSIRSLVVLPFEKRSGDPAQEFFSDGMTDALIADLAQIAALRVISRTSAMRFKGTHPALSQIASELKVDGVVEGSALRVGDRVRITVQLVDVASDRSLWAKSYERGLSDILGLQSEVARAIADEIRIQVTPEERARLRPKGAVNPAAHVAYLQGSFLWNRFTGESVKEAILLYEEALAFDPNYAVAYAGLADSYIMLANHHILPPREGYSLGRKAAEQGLSLDDSLAELHTSLGWIHRLFDWDWPAAERECLKTVEINPGYAFGRSRFALLLSGLGRHEEAIVEAARALELDPLNLLIHTVVGDTLFYARRFDRSVASYRKCLELDPTFGAAHTDLARSLEHVGRADEAVEEFLRGVPSLDGWPRPSTGLAILYARAGRQDDARATMKAVEALAQKQFVSPYGIASYYAVTADNGRALDWLERAYAERDGTMVWLKVHPRLDGLRGEPRFRDLLARMHLDS
jgi:serine/threonine protein kinase/tetratricopeptide (TPR) repeat protein